jgi:hypothetical protein
MEWNERLEEALDSAPEMMRLDLFVWLHTVYIWLDEGVRRM